MRIVVSSATSTIARACVELWASKGDHEFILVGRSLPHLKAIESDSSLRFPNSKFSSVALDMNSPVELEKLVDELGKKSVDVVLIAQGSLTEQKSVSGNLEYLKEQLTINAVSTSLFLEAFAGLLEKQAFGTLAVIGSVAGDRGRAYNYSYGSAKALIETCVQGLQQRVTRTKVKVVLIKPGPTATPMTANHPGHMAKPDDVAKVIVAGIAKGKRLVYAPKIWRLVMLLVRSVPFIIYRKLKF